MIKTLPSTKLLRECFRHERSTGKLFWRKRPLRHFKNPTWGKHWNCRWADKEAASVTSSGHLTVRLFNVAYKVHRVIWKLVKGIEPPPMLDHRDRKPNSNKDTNLRPTSYAQNTINRSKQAGLKRTRNGTWEARVHKDKKYIHLGTFRLKSEAVAARKRAASELHGEFAP